MAKMMEQGPVLLITFLAQQIMVVRNSKGEIVEGDPVSTTDVKENKRWDVLFCPSSIVS